MAFRIKFAKQHIYPIAVIGGVGLVILFALLLSNGKLNRFLSPFDRSNGSPQVTLKSADNAIEAEGYATLINKLDDNTQTPYYDSSADFSNRQFPTPVANPGGYDLFRIQGRIEVTP